jgi:ABC-type sugar transport system permease subunit
MKVWLAIAVSVLWFSGALAQVPSSVASTATYQRGQQDRQQYESWFHSLSGDYLSGASYWEAHRSVRNHAACDLAAPAGSTGQWVEGCLADKAHLDGSDLLRHESSTYRAGWNHPDAGAANSPASPSPDATEAASSPNPNSSGPVSIAAGAPASPTPDSSAPKGAVTAVVIGIVVIATLLALYFIPTLVAMGRRKRNTAAIFALNLFLGWTLLGWVLALVWSLSVDPQIAA